MVVTSLFFWMLKLKRRTKNKDCRKGISFFTWSKRRDSILARTTRSVFHGRGRPPEVRSAPFPLRVPCSIKQKKIYRKGISFSLGRSGGTRTHGLQYPKLARYHLRYASKYQVISPVGLGQCCSCVYLPVLQREYYITSYCVCQFHFYKLKRFNDITQFV